MTDSLNELVTGVNEDISFINNMPRNCLIFYNDPWRKIAKYNISPYYGISPTKKRHYQILTKWIQNNLALSDSILEVGCGTGLWGVWLNSLGYKNYLGVDVNEMLIWIGTHNHNVKLEVQDGEHTDYPDHSFDCVCYANSLFNFVPNQSLHFIREGFRLSRKYVEFDTSYINKRFNPPNQKIVDEQLKNCLITKKFFGQRVMWICRA